MRKSHILIYLSVILLLGCGASKGKLKLFNFQAAETMKLSDKITGVEQLKMADELDAQGTGIANKNENINTTVGGNQSVNNDSKLIEKLFNNYKVFTTRIILALMVSLGAALTAIMGLLSTLLGSLIWIIKYLLKRDSSNDEFLQEQIKKREN